MKWPTFPPLTVTERDEVHRLLDAFSCPRERRSATHTRRLDAAAYRAGRELAAGSTTLDVVTKRLDALAYLHDPETPIPVGLLAGPVARAVVADAFARGVRHERCRHVA